MLAEGLNMPHPTVLLVFSSPPAWAPYTPAFKSRFLSFCLTALSPFLLFFHCLLLSILLTGLHNMALVVPAFAPAEVLVLLSLRDLV